MRHAALGSLLLATVLVASCQGHLPAVDDAKGLVVGPDVAWRGTAEAPVVIEEFSDFECPFCRRGAATMDAVLDAYEGKVLHIFRHNPLPFHRNAGPAAQAAVAALRQGRFWEYHDLLFTSSERLTRSTLELLAEKTRLDLGKFRGDMESPGVAAVVQRDIRRGESLGVRGTPIFFVNGRMLPGARPFADFQTVIDEELAKAEELLAEGLPPEDVAKTLTSRNRAPATMN